VSTEATVFFLVRHALCDPVGVSIAGRTGGVPLNGTGRLQADSLAERLHGVKLHALYSDGPGSSAPISINGLTGSASISFPDETPALVRARDAGYVQAVDGGKLLELAEERDLLVEMRVSVGDFVFHDKVAFRVWQREHVNEDLNDRLLELLVTGVERTPQQDIEFSIGAVAAIAVKSLSTGINDPGTAMLAIDRLTEILAALAGKEEPAVRADESGLARLIARRTTFERAAGLALDQIRLYGAGNPSIVKKIFDSMLDLLPLLNAREAAVIRREADQLQSAARSACPREDLAGVEQLALRVLRGELSS
jgi:uncharacterized membrane protein